jgi:hypothetical protein
MQVREHFCRNVEGAAGVCQKRRQVFAERLLTQNKTAASKYFHRLLALKEPAKRVENDGFERRAGDEARTRDSLLGRQVVSKTPLASYKMASHADLAMPHRV